MQQLLNAMPWQKEMESSKSISDALIRIRSITRSAARMVSEIYYTHVSIHSELNYLLPGRLIHTIFSHFSLLTLVMTIDLWRKVENQKRIFWFLSQCTTWIQNWHLTWESNTNTCSSFLLLFHCAYFSSHALPTCILKWLQPFHHFRLEEKRAVASEN
jgi:hypothetical protein